MPGSPSPRCHVLRPLVLTRNGFWRVPGRPGKTYYCWWFRDLANHLGCIQSCKIINYQAQLVIARFLNHEQYRNDWPIWGQKRAAPIWVYPQHWQFPLSIFPTPKKKEFSQIKSTKHYIGVFVTWCPWCCIFPWQNWSSTGLTSKDFTVARPFGW